MNFRVEQVVPTPPPKKIIIELDEDEAKRLRDILYYTEGGNVTANGKQHYFARIPRQSIPHNHALYYQLADELGSSPDA